jgi:hypothetical protein
MGQKKDRGARLVVGTASDGRSMRRRPVREELTRGRAAAAPPPADARVRAACPGIHVVVTTALPASLRV